jgi:LPS-assembly lipoprotein
MRWLSAAALGLCLSASAGCGFHPIYASLPETTSVNTEMAQVKVDPIDYNAAQAQKLFRLGQQLHNALVARINPDGSPGKATYSLRVLLSETQSDTAIDPSGLSQRSSITESAIIKLVSLTDGKQVMTATITGLNSFGNVTNAYATVEGRNDARTRAISYIADDIATRVALYFRQQSAEAK